MNLTHNIFALSLIIFTSCGPDPRIPNLFGGAEAITTMNTPNKVEAWRTIAPHKLEEEKMGGKTITQTKGKLADYLIVKGPVEVDAQAGAEIATILQSNIYDWDQPPKDCLPNPGFAVQYTKGSNNVLVFFCFECSIMLTYFNGGRARSADFGRGDLLPLLKKVSP